MKSHELKTLLPNLLSEAGAVTNLAVTAENAKKSLSGHGPYADKFHACVVAVTATEKKVRPHLPALELSDADVAGFDTNLATVTDIASKGRERVESLRALKLLCETVILHRVDSMTASPIPATEQVIPMDVVRGTRGFIEAIVIQINGCFEHQWYDACSVMIRKLAETLIIAVYERYGDSHEIKGPGPEGNFLMLSKLIDAIKTKTVWNLNRETKTCLDEMKKVGDRAAHTRNYVAKKGDVEAVLRAGLRVAVDDLLHHADYKK
jgi:hypothetical protein